MRTIPPLRVLIQGVDHSVEIALLPQSYQEEDSGLDGFRKSIQEGPLGADHYDIFFPNWKKSPYIVQDGNVDHSKLTWSEIEEAKKEIETPEQLYTILESEETSPGSTSIVLQKCRSKRYSRKPPTPSAIVIPGRRHRRRNHINGQNVSSSRHKYFVRDHQDPGYHHMNQESLSQPPIYGPNCTDQQCVGVSWPLSLIPSYHSVGSSMVPAMFPFQGSHGVNFYGGSLAPYGTGMMYPAGHPIQQEYHYASNPGTVGFQHNGGYFALNGY